MFLLEMVTSSDELPEQLPDWVFDEPILEVVEKLQPYLTSEKVSWRTWALDAIVAHVSRIKVNSLSAGELDVLAEFVAAKIGDDHHSLLASCFRLMRFLLSAAATSDAKCVTMLQQMWRNVVVQSMRQDERLLVHKCMAVVLVERLDVARQLGADFVWGFIQCIDSETDPRNLVLALRSAAVLAKNFRLGPKLAEDLFEMISCYFPIELKDPGDDVDVSDRVTRRQLSVVLHSALTASAEFAPQLLPLAVEKLTSQSPNAKKDALDLICTVLPMYDFEKDISKYSRPIFDALKRNVYHDDLSEKSLNAILLLLHRSLQEDSSMSELMESFLDECGYNFGSNAFLAIGNAHLIGRSLLEFTEGEPERKLANCFVAMLERFVKSFQTNPISRYRTVCLESMAILCRMFCRTDSKAVVRQTVANKGILQSVIATATNALAEDKLTAAVATAAIQILTALVSFVPESMLSSAFNTAILLHLPEADVEATIAELIASTYSCNCSLVATSFRQYASEDRLIAVERFVTSVCLGNFSSASVLCGFCEILVDFFIAASDLTRVAKIIGFLNEKFLSSDQFQLSAGLQSLLANDFTNKCYSLGSSTDDNLVLTLAVQRVVIWNGGTVERLTSRATPLLTDGFSSPSDSDMGLQLSTAVYCAQRPRDGLTELDEAIIKAFQHFDDMKPDKAGLFSLCVASLVNKVAPVFTESIVNTLLQWTRPLKLTRIYFIASVIKGCLLKADPRWADLFNHLLSEALENSDHLVNALEEIVIENPLALTRRHGAKVKLLYKQRFYSHCFPLVVRLFDSADELSRAAYQKVAVTLLKHCPQQLLASTTFLEDLRSIIVGSLRSSPTQAGLACMVGLLQRDISRFEVNCDSIILPLINVANDESFPMGVRIEALRCLGQCAGFSLPTITRHRCDLIRKLRPLVSARKRLIRQETASVIGRWMLTETMSLS